MPDLDESLSDLDELMLDFDEVGLRLHGLSDVH